MVALAPRMPSTHTVSTPPRSGVSWVMVTRSGTATVVVGAGTGASGGAVVGTREQEGSTRLDVDVWLRNADEELVTVGWASAEVDG